MEAVTDVEVYHCGAEGVSCVVESYSDVGGYVGYFLVV